MSWRLTKKPRSSGTGGGPVDKRFKPPLLVPVSNSTYTGQPASSRGKVVKNKNKNKRKEAAAGLGWNGEPIAEQRKLSSRVSKKELALLQKVRFRMFLCIKQFENNNKYLNIYLHMVPESYSPTTSWTHADGCIKLHIIELTGCNQICFTSTGVFFISSNIKYII